jgi:hypothetical protein
MACKEALQPKSLQLFEKDAHARAGKREFQKLTCPCKEKFNCIGRGVCCQPAERRQIGAGGLGWF